MLRAGGCDPPTNFGWFPMRMLPSLEWNSSAGSSSSYPAYEGRSILCDKGGYCAQPGFVGNWNVATMIKRVTVDLLITHEPQWEVRPYCWIYLVFFLTQSEINYSRLPRNRYLSVIAKSYRLWGSIGLGKRGIFTYLLMFFLDDKYSLSIHGRLVP